MECYIPLERSISTHDLSSLKDSHKLRKFVIFDEDLKLVLHSDDQRKKIPNGISIWINDTKVHQSPGVDEFEKVNKDRYTWELKPKVCSLSIFRSNVVMNNGYNNQIKFFIEYTDEESTVSELSSCLQNDEEIEKVDDYLPSFEALSSQTIPIPNKIVEEPKTLPIVHKVNSITLKFPIYSILNMRLRNALQKTPGHIISSLDFQTSKASIQFAHRFLPSGPRGRNFRLNFDEVTYELVDKGSHIRLEPICPFKIPFIAEAHDGYSVSYKLPLLPEGINNGPTNRARVTLRYNLVSLDSQLLFSLPILTTWETDVTLKRPMSNSMISQASSNLSTPRLYGVSPRTNLMGSTISLVNSKQSNVKFKFTNKKISAMKGEKFTLNLQIINASSSPLDLVVYYNNKITPPNQLSASMPLEKHYQLYKRYHKITEGIILLSNDFKIPLVDANETYSIDLNFVGIMSGYYSTLPGLKMVDLQTNELIEIGMGASILIK